MTARTYQRRIAELKQTIADMQWVRPAYNGNDSCAGCGSQRHWGCEPDCPAALVTGDHGTPETALSAVEHAKEQK